MIGRQDVEAAWGRIKNHVRRTPVVELPHGEFGVRAPLVLKPQARMFSAPPTETSESAIATRLDGQLYTVIGKSGDDGRWQLRLWWKPFVTLIWLGGAMVAFGGFLALLGRVLRGWRARRRDDEEAFA